MASEKERKIVAGRRTVSDISARAAFALDWLVPGRNRDKLVAQKLNVSVRMAQYLRCGQHWTLDRLAQAGRSIAGFDALVHAPSDEMLRAEMMALRERLDQLETHLTGGQRIDDRAALGGASADEAGKGTPQPRRKNRAA